MSFTSSIVFVDLVLNKILQRACTESKILIPEVWIVLNQTFVKIDFFFIFLRIC